MNKKQRTHMMRIMGRFIPEWTAKYSKGTREHKSNLGEDYSAREILAMLKEEVLDLTSYVYTLEDKLDEMEDER